MFTATTEDWTKVHSVNALGVALCFKYAAIQMIKQGRGGRIIGASSGAGKQGQPPFEDLTSSVLTYLYRKHQGYTTWLLTARRNSLFAASRKLRVSILNLICGDCI